MINDVKLIYITCGFLRLICSVLLTVCSHFKVNLSIGQFISFQKEQRLLPVFPLLNATVRIIEPLATTFRKELLSGRSEVQILLATPETPPKTLIFQGFRRFLFTGNIICLFLLTLMLRHSVCCKKSEKGMRQNEGDLCPVR